MCGAGAQAPVIEPRVTILMAELAQQEKGNVCYRQMNERINEWGQLFNYAPWSYINLLASQSLLPFRLNRAD